MTAVPPATKVFDRDFLPVRAKLLEVAASLDRVARAGGPEQNDPRWQQIRLAIETLLTTGDDHAERLQRIFSRPYDDAWRERFGLESGAEV